MNLDITYRDITSTDAIRDHIEEKAREYLEELTAEDEHIRVVVGAKDHRHYSEIYWHDVKRKKDFFAKEEGDNLYQQIDDMFANISQQLQKEREKQVDRTQKKEPLKRAVR